MKRLTMVGLGALILFSGCDGSLDDSEVSSPETSALELLDASLPDAAVDRDRASDDAGSAVGGIRGQVNGTYGGVPFRGVLEVSEFLTAGDRVIARGRLTNVVGDLSEEARRVLTTEEIAFPVMFGPIVRPQVVQPPDGGAADGGVGVACDVLFLRIQPIDLDLLGLVLNLDTVTLNIDAVPGAGNLLGNLLCSVAGLLDPGSPLGGPSVANLTQVTGLLNQLLQGLLGGGGAQAPALGGMDGGVALPGLL